MSDSILKRYALLSSVFHLVGLSVAVGICWLAVVFLLRPIEVERKKSIAEAEGVEEILQDEQSVTLRNQSLKRSLQEVDTRITRLLERIPNVPKEADYLGQVTALAKDVGLEIVDYRPASIQEHDEYHEMTVSLLSEGSYTGLCHFLNQISALPRLSRINELIITPRGKGTYSVETKLTIFFAPSTQLATQKGGAGNATH